jgi:uncharacterized protein with HEPN domain
MRRPKRALRLRLWDILNAIRVARRAVGALSLPRFEADEVQRFAAERSIEIISEASRHVPDELKAKHEHVPWAQITSIGNVIRHGYHIVDAEIIWKIVKEQLTPLEAAVRELLAELDVD